MKIENEVNIKPTFLVVGAGKAGSTTLYTALKCHHDIFGSQTKEIMFFSNNYGRGYPWYESFFKGSQDYVHRFEASPQYSFIDEYPKVSSKIYDYNDKMKIIYIVRNPLYRIISHFVHWSVIYPEKYCDFNVTMLDNELRKPFVYRSMYWRQINPYLKLFGGDNCCVVFLEDLISNYKDTLGYIFDFLNVDKESYDYTAYFENKGSSEKKKKVIAKIEKSVWGRCYEEISDDISTFLKFFGKQSNFWKYSL